MPSHWLALPPCVEVHKTGTDAARTSDFRPGPSPAVSTILTNWPGDTSWMDAGSAIRNGTAAVAGAVPVSSPGPTSWALVGICPFRNGDASCLPRTSAPVVSAPAGAPSGITARRVKSDSEMLAPAGRSRAADRTFTRASEAGVNWWTVIPAATHSSKAATRRRFRFSQRTGLRPRSDRGWSDRGGGAAFLADGRRPTGWLRLFRTGAVAAERAPCANVIAGMVPRYARVSTVRRGF